MKETKKKKMIVKDLDTKLIFNIKEALPALKKVSSKKFDESVDLAITLGVDAKKSDQQVRGVISLPKMPEKKNKVAVFAD